MLCVRGRKKILTQGEAHSVCWVLGEKKSLFSSWHTTITRWFCGRKNKAVLLCEGKRHYAPGESGRTERESVYFGAVHAADKPSCVPEMQLHPRAAVCPPARPAGAPLIAALCGCSAFSES